MYLYTLATWAWVYILSLCVYVLVYVIMFMSLAFVWKTFFVNIVFELFFFTPLQWSWPWSWTACMAGFATQASTQTLSWSTPKEQGGSPSLISRATLLLSVLALYSCSMEKSINGWVLSVFWSPLLSSFVFLHLTCCSVSLKLYLPLHHFFNFYKEGRPSFV